MPATPQVLPLSELANSKSLRAYQEHALSCALQLGELTEQVRAAAKGEAEPDKLSPLVAESGQFFEPLVVNVIGCAAKTADDGRAQAALLGQAKSVLEAVTQLCEGAGEGAAAGGARGSSSLLQAIDDSADSMWFASFFG